MRLWLLLAVAIAGYVALLAGNPIRGSLRDGFRCLRRYPALWTTLAVFGFCYAAFQIGLRLLELRVLLEGERPVLQWAHAWFFPHVFQVETAKAAILPAFENVAGIFDNGVTTFPFSAVAALLLLVNWQGHHGVLNRALRRRYGSWGWLIYGGISIAAVAALVKPFLLYAGLPTLGQYLPGAALLQVLTPIDWLSFLFEYLFGVCIQVYLILLVYVWVRGVNFTYGHLLDFAIRRFSSVMKWAAVVMGLSTVLIYFPRIFATFTPFSGWAIGVDSYVDHVARPLLAAFLLFFSTMQITLTFHSESLREALRDHFRFLRKNAAAVVWFLIIGLVHFYGFNFLDRALTRGLGDGSALGLLWQITSPLIGAFIAGWLLASWVCVYKRADTGRSHQEDWVAF